MRFSFQNKLVSTHILAVAAVISTSLISLPAHAEGYSVNQNARVIGVASWDILNIRKWPAAHSRTVGSAEPGARVWIERCIIKPGASDWCKIAWQGEYGWVNSRFLNLN